MGVESYNLREMPAELHEELFRDLFRAYIVDEDAGNAAGVELNQLCMKQIFEAGKISSERRLEIEIGVLACLAAARSRAC